MVKFAKSAEDILVPGVTTFVNPFSYMKLKDCGFDFQKLSCLGFDGISGVLLCRLAMRRDVVRASFDFGSLARPVFEHLNLQSAKVSLCGTTEDNIRLACERFSVRYPNIRFVSIRNGYFKSEEDINDAIQEIIRSGSMFALIGMGAGLQEAFSFRLADAGYKGSIVTCGGFLHQTANRENYYPDWVNRYNLRFLYRMIDEPKLISRYFFDYPRGMALLLWDALRGKGAFCSKKFAAQG